MGNLGKKNISFFENLSFLVNNLELFLVHHKTSVNSVYSFE